MLRIFEEGIGRIYFDNLAHIHKDHAISDLTGKAHFMRHDQHRPPLLGELPHHQQDFADKLGITRRSVNNWMGKRRIRRLHEYAIRWILR